MNDDELMNQVYRKIEREKVIINAANAMRQSSNPQVQQSLDSQVREAQKGIYYLEERMRELQMRRKGQSTNLQGVGQTASNDGLRPPSYEGMSTHQRAMLNSQKGGLHAPSQGSRSGYMPDGNDFGDPGPGGYMGQDNLSGGHGMMPPRAPFGPPAPGSTMPRARRDYTKLGQSSLPPRRVGHERLIRVTRSDKG